MLAIDTETSGLDVYASSTVLLMVSMFNDQGKSKVWKHEDQTIPAIQKVLLSHETKLFWNCKFDVAMLRKAGYQIRGPLLDVSLVARLVATDERKFDLKSMARKFLNTPYIEEIKLRQFIRKNKIDKKRDGFKGVPDDILIPYAIKDAKATLELYHVFYPALVALKMLPTLRKECMVQAITFTMEGLGIDVNHERVKQLYLDTQHATRTKKGELSKLAGYSKFNPNSPQQVCKFVYDGSRGTVPERFSRKTGKPSSDAVALMQLATPKAIAILGYRKLCKAQQTYYRPTLKRCETSLTIHPSLNSLGTITGRYSSSKPNLQNIPRPDEHWLVKEKALSQIRSMFVPREGKRFLFIDYNQIELRLAAHFAEEQWMIDAIHAGQDLHGETAKQIFKITESDKQWKVRRYLAKTLNFSILYGVGAQKFCDSVLLSSGIKVSVSEADNYIREFKSGHPGIVELFRRVAQEVARTGAVRNPYGRIIKVPEDLAYRGVNYLIQSTAADVLKDALIRCYRFLSRGGYDTRMILTVHDEIIFEITPRERRLAFELADIMQCHDFTVPIDCSVAHGADWANKKEVKRESMAC